jgi:hypothetical protein
VVTGGPWLVTAPYGPRLEAFWSCFQCDSKGGLRPAEAIRAEAAAHVRRYGHDVIVHRGTAEVLLPLATAAPAMKELTP